ncbi:MAG: hypothetical protein WC428_03055 [Candidatus Paceibacterota bacterium]|jgi:hypothetical protein
MNKFQRRFGMRHKIGIIAMILCLIVLGIATPVSADACVPLTITGGNLYTLNGYPGYAYDGNGYLLWTYGQSLSATYKRASGSNIQFADNYGNNWDECVSAVKALSGNNVPTGNWSRGSQVTAGSVSQGTAIATFLGPDNSYYGHAAIFKSYVYTNGVITGIEMWDQNWPTGGLFGKHTRVTSGTGVNNANNYYVVLVP